MLFDVEKIKQAPGDDRLLCDAFRFRGGNRQEGKYYLLNVHERGIACMHGLLLPAVQEAQNHQGLGLSIFFLRKSVPERPVRIY